ncbi:MAG: AsmA family protein, partial [Alphaproteobacteria bacterium]|nr:AsmA family protein [Alphaproteobacteria bacterium]
MRLVLYILGGLIGAALAAALAVPFLDWNRYKPEIAALVEETTGRKSWIDGDIRLRVLPAPELAVAGVRLANARGAVDPDLARLKALELRLAFWPLLAGRIEIGRVTLVQPRLSLEILADGSRAWELGLRVGNGKAADPDGFKLQHLAIEAGTLTFRDARSGLVERFEAMDLTGGFDSLAGPFQAKGTAAARGVTLGLEAAIGRIDGFRPIPISLGLGLPAVKAQARLTGSLSAARADGQFAGRLDLSAEHLGAFLATLDRAQGGRGDTPPLTQSLAATAQVAAGIDRVALEGIALRLGEARIQGTVKAAFPVGLTTLDIGLSTTRLDLDPWIAALAAQPKPAAATSTRPRALFALPADLSGTVSLVAEALQLNGALVREARLEAEIRDRRAQLRQLSAQFPGGARAGLTGSLTSTAGGAAFDGRIELQADNLRGLLGWAKLDPGPVPPDRLRQTDLTARLQFAPDSIAAREIDLRIDGSRLTGSVSAALAARPALVGDLRLDAINLDAYGIFGGGGSAGTTDWSALAEVDADLTLAVESFTLAGQQGHNLALAAGLRAGGANLRQLTVERWGGASLRAGGQAIDLARKPRFGLQIESHAADLATYLRLAGADPGRGLSGLGQVALKATIDGDGEGIAATVDAAAQHARLLGRGRLALAAGGTS